MNEKLFIYYKERASNQALIFSHMGIFRKVYIFLLYSLMLMIFFDLFCSIIVGFYSLLFVISVTVTFIFILIMSRLNKKFNLKATGILNQEYSLKSKPTEWRNVTSDIQVHIVSEYLIENNLYSKWKIEKLIEAYQKDNEKRKLSPLIAPGIMLAISIPNLSQLLSHIYAYVNVKDNLPKYAQNLDELSINIVVFCLIFIFSLIVASNISMINGLIEDIKERITDKDSPKREGLISALNNILYLLSEKRSG